MTLVAALGIAQLLPGPERGQGCGWSSVDTGAAAAWKVTAQACCWLVNKQGVLLRLYPEHQWAAVLAALEFPGHLLEVSHHSQLGG